MSWTQYHKLIASGNADPQQWQAAEKANPNDAKSALRLAILKVFEEKDAIALDMICHILITFADRLQTKSNLEGFARDLIEKFKDDFAFFYSEDSEEIMEIAQRYGLAKRERYNPALHGEGLLNEYEPGDELWFWTI